VRRDSITLHLCECRGSETYLASAYLVEANKRKRLRHHTGRQVLLCENQRDQERGEQYLRDKGKGFGVELRFRGGRGIEV